MPSAREDEGHQASFSLQESISWFRSFGRKFDITSWTWAFTSHLTQQLYLPPPSVVKRNTSTRLTVRDKCKNVYSITVHNGKNLETTKKPVSERVSDYMGFFSMKYCTEIKTAELQQHATIWMNLGFKNKTVSPKHYFRHHIIFIKLKTKGIF